MQTQRRFSFHLLTASRLALASVVIGMAFVVAGCGSKKDDSLPPPPAAGVAPPAATPDPKTDPIIKEAEENKKN